MQSIYIIRKHIETFFSAALTLVTEDLLCLKVKYESALCCSYYLQELNGVGSTLPAV